MLPISRETIAADLRRTVENGRASGAAAAERFMEEERKKPYLPCLHCRGLGAYAEAPDGSRRSMDPKDFRPEVDVYVGCCPSCRGSRLRLATVEEVVEARKAFIRGKRSEYAAVRREVCDALGISKLHFDRLADRRRTSAPNRPECVEWVLAAKIVRDEVKKT